MGKFGESRGEGEEGGWDRVDVDEVAVRKEREGVNGGDEKKQRRTRRWWVPGFVGRFVLSEVLSRCLPSAWPFYPPCFWSRCVAFWLSSITFFWSTLLFQEL